MPHCVMVMYARNFIHISTLFEAPASSSDRYLQRHIMSFFYHDEHFLLQVQGGYMQGLYDSKLVGKDRRKRATPLASWHSVWCSTWLPFTISGLFNTCSCVVLLNSLRTQLLTIMKCTLCCLLLLVASHTQGKLMYTCVCVRSTN